LRIDCGPEAAAHWPADTATPSAGTDTVSEIHYDTGMSAAAFSIDASRPGLFLLPFGYATDLRVGAGGEKLAVHRTNEWMSVVALPAGRSDIRITASPRQLILRRAMDAIFIVLLIGIAIGSVFTRQTQSRGGANMKAVKAV
jgi:hypothetical protein